jgi:hypothetical protein
LPTVTEILRSIILPLDTGPTAGSLTFFGKNYSLKGYTREEFAILREGVWSALRQKYPDLETYWDEIEEAISPEIRDAIQSLLDSFFQQKNKAQW